MSELLKFPPISIILTELWQRGERNNNISAFPDAVEEINFIRIGDSW